MKRITYASLIFLMVTLFLIPLHGKCENSQESIAKGKALHLQILGHYKKIDKFYRKPFLWGELTNKPLSCISVPEKDWGLLPEKKKELLVIYAQSLVKIVKADPFKYAKVSPTAPMAPAVRRNIAAMTDDSWGIMIGSISSDGRDIVADRIAISGK